MTSRSRSRSNPVGDWGKTTGKRWENDGKMTGSTGKMTGTLLPVVFWLNFHFFLNILIFCSKYFNYRGRNDVVFPPIRPEILTFLLKPVKLNPGNSAESTGFGLNRPSKSPKIKVSSQNVTKYSSFTMQRYTTSFSHGLLHHDTRENDGENNGARGTPRGSPPQRGNHGANNGANDHVVFPSPKSH